MQNGKFRVVLISAFFLAPRIGLAYPIHGLGSLSCAEFAKMYRDDPSTTELYFFSWAQGFMSGMNMGALATKNTTRDLAGITADQQRALRTYCANNPLKNYMDGVIEYYGKLPVSPQNSN
jgi:hypothetical protein